MSNEIENETAGAPEPKLAAPGAGIGLGEMLYLKLILKPWIMRGLDKKAAMRSLVAGRDQILDQIRKFNENDLTKRVLVKRPYFVEDSSRYWSAAMLCNHLGKVNGALAKALENGFTASKGSDYDPQDRLKAVKPEVEKNVTEEIDTFRHSVERIQGAVNEIADQDLKSRVIPHPWFGNLTHVQWVWFAGFHMRIHARQLERISRLGNCQTYVRSLHE